MADIKTRLKEICSTGAFVLSVCIGNDLKLFDALAAVSTEDQPAMPLSVAEKAGLKERYVREWLSCMACGGLIEVDEAGERFWIKSENVAALSGPEVCHVLPFMNCVLHFAGMVGKIEDVFKKDGPMGTDWNDYKGLHKYIEIFAQGKFKTHMISNFIPLTGLKEKLENENLEVLDIGCGTGFQSSLCATHFPKAAFTGIDISKDAIKTAQSRLKESGLQNLTFMEKNARELPEEWASKFDWVMLFDALHDQMRPDLCLSEIRRILKDDGTLTVVDAEGTSNVYEDKRENAQRAILEYSWSIFACLPCGSNSPDALCLGSMWGRQRAVKLFNDCGFQNVKVVPTPFFEGNVLYVCKKQ